jgi:hypothetical protein
MVKRHVNARSAILNVKERTTTDVVMGSVMKKIWNYELPQKFIPKKRGNYLSEK